MRVCLLASGSKGNALYIETRETRLLIDAGLSLRELKERLAMIGVDASQLDGVFISHEHQDHCRGLGPLARALKLPVNMEPAAFCAIEKGLGKLPGLREFSAGATLDFRRICD